MTLHLYLARRFFVWLLIVMAIFLVLFVLTDSIELSRRLSPNGVLFRQAFQLALMKSPAAVYELLPIIVALSSLATFLGLARRSELIITRAAGRSAMGSLLSPVVVAMLLGFLATTALNPMIAATLNQFETSSRQHKDGNFNSFSISRSGLWMRQGDSDGQWVIFAERANFDATRLFDVTFFEHSNDGRALRRIEADFAHLGKGEWNLFNGKSWQAFESAGVPEKTAQKFDTFSVPSNLTSKQILDSFGTPNMISFWDLKSFVERLEHSGFSSIQHRVHFQLELAQPLLLAAMVLIIAGFTMRHARAGGTGMMVLLAVLSSFAIFFIRNFAVIMGINGDIPVFMAAWSPPIAALFLAIGLLLHLEDG